MTPITVLTGFLGSGKTTLLAALLRRPRLQDTAVIINEFGEAGLDHLLVEAVDQEVVLLRQGCVCCTLNGSLAATLESLDARRIAGTVPDFRRVIIETTGIADPVPVLQTLLDGAMLVRGYGLARIITTVDAASGAATLDRVAESVRQVAVADRILITKSDLVPDTRRLTEALRDLNAHATIHKVLHGDIAPEEIIANGPIERIVRHLPRRFIATAGNVHAIRSLMLHFPAPVDFGRFADWLGGLVGAHGKALLRIKGMVAIEGQDQPLLIQGAQHIFHPPKLLPNWPSGMTSSVLVFILDGMEPASIRQSAIDEGFL